MRCMNVSEIDCKRIMLFELRKLKEHHRGSISSYKLTEWIGHV